MRALYLALALICASSVARADATINNFAATGAGLFDQITHHTPAGAKVQWTDGNSIQCKVGMASCPVGTWYVYSMDYSCGFLSGRDSAWCGVRVYSTIDWQNFTDLGNLYDGSTIAWQNRCKGQNGTFDGCYWPKMVYNAANNNYILWQDQIGGSPTSTKGFLTLTCTSPISCSGTPNTDPSGFPIAPNGGDGVPFVDDSGNGYFAYSLASTREIYVQAMNSSFTDVTGSATDTGANGEGVIMFQKGSTYYVLYGALCSYCSAGSDASYVSASSALGTYSGSTTIIANACGGQNRSLQVVTAGASTTYLYIADQFKGKANEADTNIYMQPLTFTGSAINSFSCNATVTIAGLPSTGYTPTLGSPDQSDVADAFYDICDLTDQVNRFFTFVPSKAVLVSVAMPIGLGNKTCSSSPGAGACPAPSGNLTVKLTTVSGNGPGTMIASATIPASQLNWATQWTSFALPATLTPGTHYGIELQGDATGSGACYSTSRATTSLYAGGATSYSIDGGSTWTSESASLMFSSFPPSLSIAGPGRMFLR